MANIKNAKELLKGYQKPVSDSDLENCNISMFVNKNVIITDFKECKNTKYPGRKSYKIYITCDGTNYVSQTSAKILIHQLEFIRSNTNKDDSFDIECKIISNFRNGRNVDIRMDY